MSDQSDSSTISAGSNDKRPGPLLAKVIGYLDKNYMGTLQVELLRPTGNSNAPGEVTRVKYMSPFYGVTSEQYVGQDPNDYNNTQKSYGMWMIPPDIGTTVVCFFIDGDIKKGYWIGCVPDEGMNFSMPGYAATQKLVTDEFAPDGSYARIPVAEYNKKIGKNAGEVLSDLTKGYKPRSPLADKLDAQGLLFDSTRGITTSSSRRELPSMVFGISTPGPLDKQEGSPRGPMGKKGGRVPNAPVSRLGGTSFVMDDGDERWLRRTTASDGPPDYASVEDEETDGDVTIPHNECVRIRTRTGHQILLHNSEDLIYIGNARGTSWIEMSSDGKIDIYAQDSISVRTQADFNFYADRDINMEAGRNINVKTNGSYDGETSNMYFESFKNYTNIVGAGVAGNVAIKVSGTHDETITGATKITIEGGGLNLKTTGANILTSSENMEINAQNTNIFGGNIKLNDPSPAAVAAPAVKPEPRVPFELPTETEGETLETIMLRVPTTEPWPHHENLDPESFKTEQTDIETSTAAPVPEYWRKYTTARDTFNRQPPPAEEEE